MLLIQGIQQHVEASHDMFDFGYCHGVVPTVHVCCPDGMYNRQGFLQSPEADDIGDGTDGKVILHCRM